ncbi:MAG: ATP-grasp domain-containing protein [Candidatus Paceibacterota bacterium]
MNKNTKKPTLLFVEEVENTLSNRVISDESINVVLLKFKQNTSFDNAYIKENSRFHCFVLDKDRPIKDEVERFRRFCIKNSLEINYFYNDSEYNQEKVQKFASLLKLPGALNERQARLVRDKVAMKDEMKKIGIHTILYEKIKSVNDIQNFVKKGKGFPVIVKWRRGLSSKEIYKINNEEQLKELKLDYSTGRYIVEKYCPYLIWCIDALVQEGQVVGSFLTWLPYTNLSFAEKKEKFAQITVKERPENINFDENKIAQNIINQIKLKNGYLHLEVFVNQEGKPIVCEFAWRTPGEHMLSNHSLSFEIDVYSLLINIIVGRKITPIELKGKKCVGDMFLPLTEGRVSRISSYDKLKYLDGVIAGEIKYKIGDIIKPKRQYTDCSGWLQIEGENKEEVLSRMLKVYKRFEIVTSI